MILLPNSKSGVLAGCEQAIASERGCTHRIEMRAKSATMSPRLVFDNNDGVVAADVGLVEDEGLLFRGGSFVLFIP